MVHGYKFRSYHVFERFFVFLNVAWHSQSYDDFFVLVVGTGKTRLEMQR